jgi:phosphoesterase RecJ-like protein
MTDVLAVPSHRRTRLAEIAARLRAAQNVALVTHVNADGDGTGSEVAVAAWLEREGKTVHIVNPTPFPPQFRHLLGNPDWVRDPSDTRVADTITGADIVLILDTSEPKRVGRLAPLLGGRPIAVIDHHVPPDVGFDAVVLEDPTACATGELVYDLLTVAEAERPWGRTIIEGIYTAIVMDTGSFRFSNSTRRAHAIAGDMIEQGVDPEAVYRRLFAMVPLRRIQLLRHGLDQLRTDDELPITWITVRRDIMNELDATADDVEGLIEHARSIEGTEVAILFRETSDGSTKVSLRSSGDVDVNAIARKLGGGGHVKAAGTLMGDRLGVAQEKVLNAVREAIRALPAGYRTADPKD